MTTCAHDRILWVPKGLNNLTCLVLPPPEYSAFVLGRLYSIVVICLCGYPKVLASGISWGLYYNTGFTFTALCKFSRIPYKDSNPSTYCLVSVILWNCGIRLHDPNNDPSFMHEKPLPHGWHYQFLLSSRGGTSSLETQLHQFCMLTLGKHF